MKRLYDRGEPAISISGTIYAHSLPNHPIKDWQRLDSHLKQVSECASDFAQEFDSSAWAWNAGMLHDFGKVADEFQAYLRRENHIDDKEYDAVGFGRVNHSSAGSALAEERYGLLGRILAYLIAGHHAGLPDYHTCDGGMGALQKRLEEGRADLERIRVRADEFSAALHPLSKLPTFVKQKNFQLWVRMCSASEPAGQIEGLI